MGEFLYPLPLTLYPKPLTYQGNAVIHLRCKLGLVLEKLY